MVPGCESWYEWSRSHWVGDAEEVVDKAERLGLWGDFDDDENAIDEEDFDEDIE